MRRSVLNAPCQILPHNRHPTTDIDECAAGTDGCDENANCTNTDGSYTCSCLSGYSGDGVTCVGKIATKECFG